MFRGTGTCVPVVKKVTLKYNCTVTTMLIPTVTFTHHSGSAFLTHIRSVACDFQQCGILISVNSDKPVQPPVKLRNSKFRSVR